MQFGRLWPAVGCGDPYQNVIRAVFGIFHKDVEVSIFVEDPSVKQFILHVVPGTTSVRIYQIGVGKRRVWVLVEILHVGVCRCAVEVKVVLLHILAMVALAVGQPKQSLLENWILAVPQGQREAKVLFVIGNAGDAIFAPTIGARTGMIMGEKIPGVSPLAIILADRSPLPLTEIRPPLLPIDFSLSRI